MIRTKLTIWNCAILALVLTLVGAAIYFTTRQSLLASIDQGLRQRARFMSADWPNMPRPPDRNDGRTGGFRFGSMDPVRARREGIDPHQLKEIDAMSAALRPMILKLDGTDIMFADRKPWDMVGFNMARQGESSFANAKLDGVPLRVLSIPLTDKGKTTAVAQLAIPTSNEEAELDRLARTLALILPLAVLVMLFTGVGLTRRALQPVSQIASAAEQIEAHHMSDRLPVYGKDEFAHLSTTFNTMLERLENAFAEKDEVNAKQRRFTADASHELKTPLTSIQARAGIALQRDLSPQKYREHFEAVSRAATLMTSILRDLLLLAASDEGRLELRKERVQLAEVIDNALASVDTTGREVRHQCPYNLSLIVDPSALTRVLVNLIENAVRHTGVQGLIAVKCLSESSFVEIEVSDDGSGIPAEHVALVFNRFHRVDSARDRISGGSGLGLAISKAIIDAHGGTISLTSREGEGTWVTLRIPVEGTPA